MDKYLIKEIRKQLKHCRAEYKNWKSKDTANEFGFNGMITAYEHVLSLIKKYKKI